MRHTITATWERYLRVDAPGLRGFLTDDCTRMSGRWGAGIMQRGSRAIAAHLASEAEASERPTGVIAEQHAIYDADFWVDPSGQQATAIYRDKVKSGYRWCDSDEGLVVQVLVKHQGRWLIAHWTDAFDTHVGRFRFNFSYPAADLGRAVDFYTPILGPPEVETKTRAVFLLPRGWRFTVDATRLHGIAHVTPEIPNGWATVYVDDAAARRDQLKEDGVKFLAGGRKLLEDGPDLYAVGLDEPDHNPFVLLQRNYAKNGPAPSPPHGFPPGDPAIARARHIAQAWVTTDTGAIDALYGDRGRFFDDTRVKTNHFQTGAGVARALESTYWHDYDRSPKGLSVDLRARDLAVHPYGKRTVVSYEQDLAGTGVHPFRETALVTQILGANDDVVVSFTVTSDARDSRVLGPDYIGYPTTSVAHKTEKFYTDIMGFGTPYEDVLYRGWWSDNGAVYGTYGARPARDGLPRPRLPSAYNSFWVRSAHNTYAYLKRQGVSFPRIPAIGPPGIHRNPGYTQVLATDSEGNAVVFTEYTGQ